MAAAFLELNLDIKDQAANEKCNQLKINEKYWFKVWVYDY
jgi:hypothetical protein